MERESVAKVILEINSRKAEDKIGRLEAQAKELRTQFAQAFSKGDTKAIDNIDKRLRRVNHEIETMKTRADNVRDAMVNLESASPRTLQRTLKMINEELASGRVKRGTKEWDDYIAKLKEVKTQLKKVKDEMSIDDKSFFTKIKDGFNGWGATIAAGTAAFAGVIMSGRSAVKAYADIQAEEASVIKYTGMTTDQVKELNDEFKKMDTRTSRKELNQMAQEAGRLGKSSVEDVLGYVKAADVLNVALDDLGEGATLTLSKLNGIFGDEAKFGTEQALIKAGSVVNELSQNCSASAPYLAEFTSRIGGIGAQAKMTMAQVMAFGAVLDTQNLAVEASATAVGQLITKIYQEPAKIAKAAGMDVKKFADQVKTDMNGALISLFEQLNRFGGMETLAKVFDNMGTDGARAIPVLTALAGHVEELKAQQVAATEAFNDGTSAIKEFKVQNDTVEARIEKARNGFNELAESLGKKLLPVMSECISGSSMLMRVMNITVDFVIKNSDVILGLTAAIVAYTVASKAAVAWQKLMAAWTATCTAVKTAATAATYLYAAAIELMHGNIKAARAAFVLFNQTLHMSPIGLVATAVTALVAGLVIYARRTREATGALRGQIEAEKDLTDAKRKSKASYEAQKTQIESMIKVASTESVSMKERLKIIKRLNEIIPNYNAKIDETTGKYSASKDALDEYLISLEKELKLKAIEDKVVDIEKERVDAELDLTDARENRRKAEEKFKNAQNKSDFGGVNGVRTMSQMELEATGKALREAEDAEKKAEERATAATERAKQVTETLKQAMAEGGTVTGTENNNNNGNGKPGPTDDELKEAAKKAKEALKKELDDRKAAYLQAEAQNAANYYNGIIDYKEYTDERKKLEKDYTDDVIRIHVAHNKIDMVKYSEALKKRQDLNLKASQEEQARSLKEAEQTHRDNIASITQLYYDQNSAMFNNKKALNQALLQEEISYLNTQLGLYENNAEKREEIERQIEARINKDKQAKQEETLRAYNDFQQRYARMSGSEREKLELDMLKQLHEQGLINEQEYQKAVDDIKKASIETDRQNARVTQSEYADMCLSVYDSFKAMYEGIQTNGKLSMDNIAKAMQAAVGVMSTMLSQYSSYVNAERDLQLAKIEKRYDKEIAAAGKNQKKVSKLEAQKEKEIAKVKKKYNDRAMKIELAQAIAQTATAAIAAYASAAAIPAIGWIMAPIAASLATAAGMMQIATIKKQHQAEAEGYYEGGFTQRDPNDRREVGVVHANEFVANHEAVANPALSPVLRLIDHAQRNNTVGSLTAEDVSMAIGRNVGVSARGGAASSTDTGAAVTAMVALMADTNAATRGALDRLSANIEGGIETYMVMDGENGFHSRYDRFKKLIENPKR